MLRIAAALIALIGIILFGQGSYIHAKAMMAQVLLERAFTASLASGIPVKPWSWADTWPVARIAVKRLDATAIALHGSSGQALAFGPGHVENTPEAGDPGIAVYSAHRDTHFRFLGQIVVGDIIDVTRRDGQSFRYRVTGTSVVPFDASDIDPRADETGLALTTCWPLESITPGPLRYVVHATLLSAQPTSPIALVDPAWTK